MSNTPRISPREREVLNCRREGLSWKQTAERLGISLNTAKDYMKRITRKTGASSNLAAIFYPQIARIFQTDEGPGFEVPITFIPARRKAA